MEVVVVNDRGGKVKGSEGGVLLEAEVFDGVAARNGFIKIDVCVRWTSQSTAATVL